MPGGAADEGLDADEEDGEFEGFGEVVVGAGLDAVEDVLGVGAGGEHEDGGEAVGGAEGLGDGEAVGAGEHAVEDDDGDFFWAGGGRGEEVGEGGVAVGLVVGAEAFEFEVEEEALGEVFFVFDEGNEGWGHGLIVEHCPGVRVGPIRGKGKGKGKGNGEMRGSLHCGGIVRRLRSR